MAGDRATLLRDMATTDPAGQDVKRTLTRAVALPLGFALVLGGIFLAQVLYLLSLQGWVARSDDVLAEAHRLEKLLVDQETGLRGFLLTGEEPFLEPYTAARGHVERALDRLAQLTRDQPAHAARLEQTRAEHARWLAFANEALDARRAGADIVPIVRSGRGKVRMDAMRAAMDEFIGDERALRARRVAYAARAARVVLALSGLLAIALGLVLALVTRRQVRGVADVYARALGDAARQAEALRLSEERYRRLVELSPDGVFVYAGGTIRYANRAMAALVGAGAPAQLVGRDVLGIVHPDYHEAVRARMREITEQGREIPLVEQRLLRADGGEVWVEVTAAPFRFDGSPGAQFIVRDISERIAARAARNRLEAERGELFERLQLVLDRMPAACVVNDTAFRITYWNAAAQRTFGYTFEEVRGRHPFGLITPPVAQPEVDEIFRALEHSQDPVAATNVNVTKDGRTITCAWVNSALRDPAGRFIGIISMAQDVTEELRARDALRDAAQMLAQAQQIAHLGSWELDLNSGDVQWSEEMYRIFGQDPASFRTTRDTIHALLHPDDRDAVIRAADLSYATDAPFNIDHRVVRPDGTVRHVNSQGKVIRDRPGTPQRFIGTMLDITQRKLAEEELRRLNETLEQRVAERTGELRQANEDLEAFGYTIAHDLRAPMRTMRGFAQALLEDYAPALGETGLEYARRIVAGAARVERLTEDLLAYSRLARRDLVPERVSLVLVLHDVIGQLQRDPQFARVHVEVVEPMPWVLAHRNTLAAVVSNLLENAAKFVAPGVDPIIAVRAEDHGDVTRVWFLDNGIGIAPEHHERIFHVFERLHGMEQFPGTGIGLAIVRRAVERMGGRVGVESAMGAGSRFWIELPKDPQSP